MTLVKLNRNYRDNLFPSFHSPFYGGLISELLDRPISQVLSNTPVPPVNILETENSYQIHMASPGHKKEDFNIFLEKDLLTISLEEKETENQENNNFTRQEFRAYSFKRSFNLPENSDLSSIHAEYHDGILKVGINKKPEVKPELKKVEIS